MFLSCQINNMSRLFRPCWKYMFQYDKIRVGNYATMAKSRLLYSWPQSSNHLRISATPTIQRYLSGTRYFPGDLTSSATSNTAVDPDNAKSTSSEDYTISSNQPTNSSASHMPSNLAADQDTPAINDGGNGGLSSNPEALDYRESLAVQEDEAMFLDDFNRNLPGFRPPKHPASYWDSLPPLEKVLFNPTQQLYARSSEDNINYIKKHNISVVGNHALPPLICSYGDYNFPDAIPELLQENFKAPTPIQAIGWSAALTGYDIVGVGQSGTGKTLAYLIPALLHVSHHMKMFKRRSRNQAHSPLGLVVAPTRELVDQIVKVANEYGPSIGVRAASVIGGTSRDYQTDLLRSRNVQLAVSTPSRLLELVQNGSLSLDQCGMVVLDEADKMLDSTQGPQIRTVLSHCRPGRQTMLWSATWPESVRKSASKLLSDPLTLTVGSTNTLPSSSVTQHVHVTELHDRRDMLRRLLWEHFEKNPKGKALVFAATTDDVEKLKKSLRRCSAKYSVESFQGNMLQRHRKMILDGFRNDFFSVLVATDLASRGLDIPGLSCVVNFDFPKNLETYIHRVGRTGRQGEPGVAHTFFCQRDTPKAKQLVELLKMSGQHVDSQLRYMALKQDFPVSMTDTFIPFVPLKDRFGNPLVQSESPMAGGMKETQGPIRRSIKEQAFMLRNDAKRETLVAYMKTKKHASRHCVEPAPRPAALRKRTKR